MQLRRLAVAVRQQYLTLGVKGLDGRLSGLQGFDPHTAQPVAGRYSDWANPATETERNKFLPPHFKGNFPPFVTEGTLRKQSLAVSSQRFWCCWLHTVQAVCGKRMGVEECLLNETSVARRVEWNGGWMSGCSNGAWELWAPAPHPPPPLAGLLVWDVGVSLGFGHLLTGEGSYHLSGQSLIAVTIRTTYFNIQISTY